MNWYSLIPINRWEAIGLFLLFLGFFTAPFVVGFFIMPIGSLLLVYGVFLSCYRLAVKIYLYYSNIRGLTKK
jgi:hypothetical protein